MNPKLKKSDHPLSGFAASPSLAPPEGGDSLAAGRPLLAVSGERGLHMRQGGTSSDTGRTAFELFAR